MLRFDELPALTQKLVKERIINEYLEAYGVEPTPEEVEEYVRAYKYNLTVLSA